jgi:hypothetical protein
MSRATHARFPRILAYAAVAAVLATGWMHAGSADARRVNPRDDLSTLRAELAETRAELGSYQSAYTELMNGLDKVERINARGGRNAKTKIQAQIDRTRRDVDGFVDTGYAADVEIRDHRDTAHDDYTGGGYTGGYSYGYAMDDGNFRVLLKQLKNAYASEQPTIAADAAVNAYFTVDQVLQMLKVVSYDSARVEVAAAIYSHVLDPESWLRVYDAIEYTSNRQALRERLGSAG